MMDNKKSKSTRDNFGKFINELQPKTKTFFKKAWKDPNKII